ncbi:SHOCT domain-containing protein [Agrobacterium vitis]|uniref:SHOCT domain-containing protein n=1 Tax=Allorhizobium ampelinum TaxID=3025782 RepID=UPI001F181FAF|nr:SHOCT domain-containing protein [Allorhizobium ampelinum]MCF1449861.1 SHOCT domain-containing protein [Allorhizobium ampelinum]
MTDTGDANTWEQLRDIAERHHVSYPAAEHLLAALVAGGGTQAQFNHPELGGLGQWSSGGMLMIGDMFNHGLKAKVADLCADLAGLASRSASIRHQSQSEGNGPHGFGVQPTMARDWWPNDLGSPSATGSQNDMRYAFFPSSQRLALSFGGKITVYDTKDHLISGFSQQQSADQSVTFNSQHGRIDLSKLEKVATSGEERRRDHLKDLFEGERRSGTGIFDKPAETHASPGTHENDVFDKIERLAAFHAKGILTDQEFETKKGELLARL